MRISTRGAAAGAIVCAVGRSLVVIIALGGIPTLVFLLPSAFIGLLVGVIAGGIGRPLKGALIGALLSGVIFELFLLPCASLIGAFGKITGNRTAEADFLRETFVYCLEMALAGAIAGVVGGLVARKEFAAKPPVEPPINAEGLPPKKP